MKEGLEFCVPVAEINRLEVLGKEKNKEESILDCIEKLLLQEGMLKGIGLAWNVTTSTLIAWRKLFLKSEMRPC